MGPLPDLTALLDQWGRGDRRALSRDDDERGPRTAPSDPISLLALNQVLDRLETLDRGLAAIVELRAFGRLAVEKSAHVLNVSPSTAKPEWRTARAWLMRELAPEPRP